MTIKIAALAALLAGAASANLVPTFVSDNGPVGGPYTFTYSVAIDNSQYVVNGDSLCFADVAGMVTTAGSTSAPAGWSQGTIRTTSPGCPYFAGVGTPNGPPSVQYTYTGSATIPSNTVLGNFTFMDIYNNVNANASFGASAHRNNTNGVTTNQTEVIGPAVPTGVPEPGTLLFLGSGILALALVRRRT